MGTSSARAKVNAQVDHLAIEARRSGSLIETGNQRTGTMWLIDSPNTDMATTAVTKCESAFQYSSDSGVSAQDIEAMFLSRVFADLFGLKLFFGILVIGATLVLFGFLWHSYRRIFF
jgi:hypothetical protein